MATMDRSDSPTGNGIPNGGRIPLEERDYYLKLHSEGWGRTLEAQGWQREPADGPTAYLHRTLTLGGSPNRELLEVIVRFPSAPVYGINRRHDYQHSLGRINFHTMRLFRRPLRTEQPTPLRRIYLLHNGLNETEYSTLYYRLADVLVDDESACIVRPFPGHLTRFPLPNRFCEQPLDRYLADAGDLYRQYLRFMMETQWLLSALVPIRSYRAVAGLDLLAEGTNDSEGRESTQEISKAIHAEWQQAFVASQDAGQRPGERIAADEIERSVKVLRELVGWRAQPSRKRTTGDVDLDLPPPRVPLCPALHVMGYSLGGYLAQSIFFTWPFAVSSCTTICSGGALQELELTKFADPEEWQTVIRALRYEIESSMLEHRLERCAGRIAGLKTEYFRYFHRIFNEVFLQDHPGSYKSRVSEYLSRLLFIVGGNDPIVSIPSVLEAGPQEGINLIEVADLPHFIGREPEWQRFSEPYVVDSMKVFSHRAERILALMPWFDEAKTRDLNASDQRPSPGRARSEFQHELDAMVVSASDGGWLFVFRNQVPVVFLGPQMLHLDGAALYHADNNIADYIRILEKRRRLLENEHRRVTIVLPDQLKYWFCQAPPILSENVETASGGAPPTPEQLREMWDSFYRRWERHNALREFSPNPAQARNHELVSLIRAELGNVGGNAIINTLPDVWLSFSKGVLGRLCLWRRRRAETMLVELAHKLYVEEQKQRERNQSGAGPATRTLERWLNLNDVRIVKVSAAEFNQRHIGESIRDVKLARRILIHAAIAYLHSK